jgi:choline dehydrogenase-like flavoprotein
MEAIIRAGNERGVPRNDDFNGATQEGVGYYQLFTRQGWRCSTAVAYLKPARGRTEPARRNRRPRYRHHLRGHARGGSALPPGRPGPRVRAAREVVLSAGALQSPQLLQLSGVGDAARLQALGIPVTHHLPGVGENLQDHLQLRLMYKVKKPITTNDDLRPGGGSSRWAGSGSPQRKGPLAIGINQGGMFTRILPESTTPDIQFHFASLSAEMAGAKPHPWSGCTFSVCQLRPHVARHGVRQIARPAAAPACSPTTCRTTTDRRAPWPRSSSRATWRRRRRWPTTSARNTARPRRASDEETLLGAQLRRHDLPSVRHLQDGQRRHGRGRRAAARARPGRAARGRLLDHADAGVGQHQRAGGDDRRARQRLDPRRRAGRRGRGLTHPIPTRSA